MVATATSYNPSFRYGDANHVKVPFKATVAVNVGDFCYIDDSDSSTVKPAMSYTWATAVATPAAPTVTNGAVAIGTGLTNALTGVKVSYQFPWGEGALSAAGTATPTAGAAIVLTGVALPAPVIGLNVYVETAAGSGTYKLWGQYLDATGTLGIGQVFITGYGLGQAPPGSTVLSDATTITQYNFVQAFAGVSAQQYDGVNASAYGIQDGTLRIDTGGIFDFICASQTFNAGDYLMLVKDTGNNLTGQTLTFAAAGGTSALLSVARVVQAYTAATTIVRAKLINSRFGRNQ